MHSFVPIQISVLFSKIAVFPLGYEMSRADFFLSSPKTDLKLNQVKLLPNELLCQLPQPLSSDFITSISHVWNNLAII